jgi:glycosyltransferase involved in cell wall biosynthesis
MRPVVYGVLPRPPHPTRDGLAIRNYHLLASLAERFEVQAFSLLDPARSYGGGEAPPGVRLETVPQERRGTRRLVAAIRSLASAEPYPELLYRSEALTERLVRACADRPPAWIVAHSYHVAPAALAPGAPVWIDFHNLDSEIWGRMAEGDLSFSRRLFVRAQVPRIRRFERSLVRRAAGTSCVSSRDRAALARLGPASEPVVVPNGVDLSRYAFRDEAPAGERILFVGDLSWPPNAEAVRWFAERVWPIVRARRPSASVEIVGREAPESLRGLAGDAFRFAGESGDTRPHWSAAAVAVVPLRAGGGTRLKILEAAACGVPVVSTPVGAEGLEWREGAEIRVADDPAIFAEAVAELLADPLAAKRQAAAARSRVEALYDWKRIGESFAEALSRRGETPA